RNCPVMQSGSLLDEVHVLPVKQVLKQRVELRFDLLPGDSEIEVDLPRLACPLPDLPEHLAMQFQAPDEIEWSHFGSHLAEEVFVDGLGDVLAFCFVELPTIANVAVNQTRRINRGLAGNRGELRHALTPQLLALLREQLCSRL